MDLTYNTLSPVVVTAEIEQNFTDVTAALQALESKDFKRRAGLPAEALASPHYDQHYVLKVRAENLAAGWPGGNAILAAVPFNYAATYLYMSCQISWVCLDTGNNGKFRIGIRNANSSSILWMMSADAFIRTTGPGNDARSYDLYSPPQTWSAIIGSGVPVRWLNSRVEGVVAEIVLVSTVADATALSGVGSFFNATVLVRNFLRST